ncbi:hypothetical protein [Pectobacterium sp. LFLA-215]|uniref:hypothetical protein n=1 Tax=Pectobacterium sp. LFLA-215 TaxID=3419008 RepID=UPI003F5B2B93
MKPLSGGRQADNPFSVAFDVGRGLTPEPAPPGKAATPSVPRKERGCRQQRAQPCAPRCSEEHNPGGQPHADVEEDRNAPIP